MKPIKRGDLPMQNIPIRTPEGTRIREALSPEGSELMRVALGKVDYAALEKFAAQLVTQDFSSAPAAKDCYSTMAAELYGVPEDEVTPEMRKRAKDVNFWNLYGQSNFWGAHKKDPQEKEED